MEQGKDEKMNKKRANFTGTALLWLLQEVPWG